MEKKLTLKNSKGLKIVGLLTKKSKDKLIILSHGLTDDKSSHGRYDALAQVLAKAGFSVFRFDFTGFGESDATNSTIKKQINDLKYVIKKMKSLGFKEFGLMGHSLGGFVSIKNYSKDIKTMVLWAPVTIGRKDLVNYLTPEQWTELKEKGYITYYKPKRKWRKIMRMDGEFLKERKMIKQKENCIKVKCPVLIIHGDKDITTPLEYSISALKYLPKGSMLEMIKEEDHFFLKKTKEVIEATARWVVQRF